MDQQELIQERKDAKVAMEKAQSKYEKADEALEKWKQENPGYSIENQVYKALKAEMDKCYDALERKEAIYKK